MKPLHAFPFSRFRGFPLGLILFLLGLASSFAQVDVRIEFRRTLYLIYEPIICTVSVTNRTGKELTLQDTPQQHWFGFEITRGSGNPVPPINPSYINQPVQIGSGQTLKRSINLTPLFPLSEFGAYRVRATIYVSELKKFFTSPPLGIEITEGRLLWQETVGIPDGPGSRSISVLAHRLPQTSMLYIRIEDKDAGIVYCTHQLGRFIAFGRSDIELDVLNRVHILQNVAPKSFVYSVIGLNGEVLERQAYQDQGTRPVLTKLPDGSMKIAGGTPYDPKAPQPKDTMPTLSDRPVPLPTPEEEGKSDEIQTENLLSR